MRGEGCFGRAGARPSRGGERGLEGDDKWLGRCGGRFRGGRRRLLPLGALRGEGGKQGVADLIGSAEANLAFGRVDVDVHLLRRQVDEQHHGGARLGALPGIGLAKGIRDGGGRGGASVHEHELVASQGGIVTGTFGVAVHVHGTGIRGDGHERLGELRAEEGADAFLERRIRGEPVDLASIEGEREAHVGVGEGVDGEGGADVPLLGDERAEELAPGGHVAEEVAHLHARAGRRAAGLHLGERAGVDDDARAFFGVARRGSSTWRGARGRAGRPLGSCRSRCRARRRACVRRR